MDALGMSEVREESPVRRYFLFERNVRGVDPGVRIIPAEDSNTAKTREWVRTAALCRGCNESRPHRENRRVCEQAAGNRLLLDAVGCYRTNLRQHILPRVVDSPTRSQHRPALLCQIPGESNAWLEHLLLVR